MTPVKAPPEQEQAFPAEQYDDPRLKLEYVDGKRVDKISLRFGGTIELTRSNPEHVDLYRRLILGREVDLAELQPVVGRVTNKATRQVLGADGYVSDVHQVAVITITDVGGVATAPAAADPDDEGGDPEE